MSCSVCDPWGGNLRGTCFICKPQGGSANGEIGTSHTHSTQTATDGAGSAVTPSSKNGILTPPDSPYIDIVSDLLLMLHGHGKLVDETPLMHIAASAIEFELAERMLDNINLINPGAPD